MLSTLRMRPIGPTLAADIRYIKAPLGLRMMSDKIDLCDSMKTWGCPKWSPANSRFTMLRPVVQCYIAPVPGGIVELSSSCDSLTLIALWFSHVFFVATLRFKPGGANIYGKCRNLLNHFHVSLRLQWDIAVHTDSDQNPMTCNIVNGLVCTVISLLYNIYMWSTAVRLRPFYIFARVHRDEVLQWCSFLWTCIWVPLIISRSLLKTTQSWFCIRILRLCKQEWVQSSGCQWYSQPRGLHTSAVSSSNLSARDLANNLGYQTARLWLKSARPTRSISATPRRPW